MDRRTIVQAAVTGAGAAALLPVGHLTGAALLLGGFSRIGLGDVVGAQDVATRLAAAYLADPSEETRAAAVASDAAALVGAAALVSREELGWDYWSQHAELSGWNSARPMAYSGLRQLYMGRYREAIPLFEAALDGTLVQVRRARPHADLTKAWAGLGDRDQARSAGMAALDEAGRYGLGGVRDDIRALREGFPPSWEGSASLAELDERLAAS